MDNNKKIMRFLGYKIAKCKTINSFQWDCESSVPLAEKLRGKLTITKFPFETDWNLLMPIVEFIEKKGYVVEISDGVANVKHVTNGTKFFSEKLAGPIPETKQEKIYVGIMTFINWNNRNKEIT